MQVPRPPAIGHQAVVKRLRSVLFSEVILAAASVRPKGYMKVALAPLFGWCAPILARRATDPFPPTILYLAVTAVDIRLFSKPPAPGLIAQFATFAFRLARISHGKPPICAAGPHHCWLKLRLCRPRISGKKSE